MIERLENVAQLFSVFDEMPAFSHYRPWWRGQTRDWPLVAPVHRVTDRGLYERGLTLRFKARAASRYPNVPARDDTLGWLTLMQHYHLPTRCLDWTESPLVGLYFAVSDLADDKVDGVLWALDPFRLNECLWKREWSGTFAPEMPALAPLFDVLSGKPLARYPSSVGKADVAALTPAQSDLRTLVQMSCFTIHANDTPLEGHPESERFLRRITIDAQSKRAIRHSLKEAGFTESQLFPDLEHLAHEEAAKCFCRKQPCPHSSGYRDGSDTAAITPVAEATQPPARPPRRARKSSRGR